MTFRDKPVEIAESIFWVGTHTLHNQLNCNAYLIVSDEGSVLIDPGSVLDFDRVYQNIRQIIDPQSITHFVLQHQDPDLCSAVPLFEQKGIVRPLVTHWRSSCIIFYYGVKGPFYLVDHHGFQLTMNSGRVLRFLHTPYLHFPGAIVTYDAQTETLFSSDLFGAFFVEDAKGSLYADSQYVEAMKSFHEHYMPSNDLLRPIMEMFLNMSIRRIAPQHGSIIEDNVQFHIRVLRDLECGTFIRPIMKDRAEFDGYVGICNQVIRRCRGIAGEEATFRVFENSDIVLDRNTGQIDDFSTSGEDLWHNIFRIIEQRQGLEWLIALEVLVRKLSAEFGIPMPDVYQSSLSDLAMQAAELDRKYQATKALSDKLARNIEETEAQLIRDPVSGLFNADFFMRYLHNTLEGESSVPGAFLLVSIDNLQVVNFKHGTTQGDAVIKNCGRLIHDMAAASMMVARLEGAMFSIYQPAIAMSEAVKWAETLRVAVSRSQVFIEPITVSIGVVHTNQVPETVVSVMERIQYIYRMAGMRVRIAKNRGANYVCEDSTGEDYSENSGKVLLIDTDEIHLDILSTMLRQMDLNVSIAQDGDTALEMIETILPDIVISEVMVPKVDGLAVRERMMATSGQKRKPFVLISHVKNEMLVQRAQEMDIVHYFNKPYLLSEVVGLVKNLLRKQSAS